MARTINPRYRIALGLFVVAIHMFFLLYLHFAYHELAESMFEYYLFLLRYEMFLFIIAVSHAMNQEATIPMESPVKPVLPFASPSIPIAPALKSNFPLIDSLIHI